MRTADNHIGWCVEWLSPDGWKPVTMPLTSHHDVTSMRDFLHDMNLTQEYRVMEAVE